MINDITLPWIKAGYELFATEGPKGLKVEVIARKVGKSKSSFYHHFADLELFTEVLLDYHLSQAQVIAQRENACKNVDPELLMVLVDVKQDLLFNRQLRFHRDVPAYKICYEKANQSVSETIVEIWAKELGLGNKLRLADNVLSVAIENFYFQLTEETLNYEWLRKFVQQMRTMVNEFQRS